MIYLSGVHSEGLATAAGEQPVGLMLQPGNGYGRQIERYRWWAADNGCFAQGDAFDAERWLEWLAGLGHQGSCLFAVAPDVLADARATRIRSLPWLSRVRALGYPPAFVAQDGCESAAEAAQPPWDEFDVLFIGGTTRWKLSGHAAWVVTEAMRRGKWVHMGRVNSLRRIQAAKLMGCDSVDGTVLAFRARKQGRGDPLARGVPELLGWLGELVRTPFLPLRGENR